MKKTLLITLIATIVLSNCKKSNDAVTHVNCDGLITDTLGTGDTARIYMQNAFTPNGDFRNDISRPIVKGLSSIVFTIYDANNNIVFTTTQLSAPDPHGLASCPGWSTSSPSTYEIYYYKIQGTTIANHHIGTCGELYKLACFPSTIPKSSLFFEDQLLINGTYDPNTGETIPNCP